MPDYDIGIFGMPRSGTKIVQLYTCIDVLKEYNQCYLTYEPFYHLDRRCTEFDRFGIFEHLRLPLFATEESNSEYLKKRTTGDHYPCVSKMIKGVGRIPMFTKWLKPVLIIRPVHEIINSFQRSGAKWDCLGRNHLYNKRSKVPIEWIKIRKERDIDQIKDKWRQNAVYWYEQNKYALNWAKKHPCLVLDYRSLKEDPNLELTRISEWFNLPQLNCDFQFIDGGWIHTDHLLKTTQQSFIPKAGSDSQVEEYSDQTIYKEMVKLKQIKQRSTPYQSKAVNKSLSENNFYKQLNEDIFQRVENLNG